MKRLIFLLLALIFALVRPVHTAFAAENSDGEANASSRYAIPAGRECYFCEEKKLSSALFCIPYTYCVEILKDDGEWLYVSYAEDTGNYKKLYGYCLSDEFTEITAPPQNVFLSKSVSVTFSAGEDDSPLTQPTDVVAEAAYYGIYRLGANYYSYVLLRGDFCYIEGANDDYPLNEFSDEGDDEGDNSADETEESGNVSAELIIFTVILIVALVVICVLAFGGKKNKE